MPRGSKPGERRGGRQKGTPNKNTAAAKEAIARAFEGSGGVVALTQWAKRNPTEFYKLYARLIPVDGTIQTAPKVIIIDNVQPKG